MFKLYLTQFHKHTHTNTQTRVCIYKYTQQTFIPKLLKCYCCISVGYARVTMRLHPTKVEYSYLTIHCGILSNNQLNVKLRIISVLQTLRRLLTSQIRVKLSGVLRKLIRYIKQLKGQIRINPYPYLLRSHYLMLVLNRSIYTFTKDGTHQQGN